MRILVTGASGFVGSAASAYLGTMGHEVIRFVGPERTSDTNTFPVDIADPNTFPDPRPISPLDAVVHCAGIAHRLRRVSKEDFDRVNVKGVANVIRFAAETGARKFVLLSSVLVYGTPANDEAITEEYPTAPEDDYGISKLEGEQLAIRLCAESLIKLVILRPAPIIGEGSRGNFARLTRSIDRRLFLMVGNGDNRRSLVYVGDVAKAILRSLDIDDGVTILNVAGDPISVKRLVEIIAARLGRTIPPVVIPARAAIALAKLLPMAGGTKRTLETWVSDAVFSGSSFSDRYDFFPETPIEDAIARDVDHFKLNR